MDSWATNFDQQFFFLAISRIFSHGYTVPIHRLYPPVQFPVSRGTSMIAPLVRWEHSEDWFVTKFELQRSTRSGERRVNISLTDQDYDFIAGHSIDGEWNWVDSTKNAVFFQFKSL